jgi:CBS domain-containing protein
MKRGFMSDTTNTQPDYLQENNDAQMYSSIDVSILRRSLKTIMKPAITVPIETTINDCIRLMQKKRIGCVLVTSHGKLLGIFTERDVLKKIFSASFDLDQTPITEVMTTNPQVLNEIDTIAYALNFMDLGGYRHIPVVNNVFEPLGIVSVKDIVSYFVEHFADEVLNLPPHPYTIENAPDDDFSAEAEEDAERED